MSTKKINSFPLCVDLDGTLLKEDITGLAYESCQNQSSFQWIPCLRAFWRAGRSGAKCYVAEATNLENIKVGEIPINAGFHAYLKKAWEEKRPLILATGAPQRLAEHVAQFFGFFDEVIGSQPGYNCIKDQKAQVLLKKFGRGKFSYAGNSWQDVAVWKEAFPEEIIGVDCPFLLRTYLKSKYKQNVILF